MNAAEYRVYRKLSRVGQVMRNGWPDFLVKLTGGKIVAVEVKSGNDFVKRNQQMVHDALRLCGIEVRIIKAEAVYTQCQEAGHKWLYSVDRDTYWQFGFRHFENFTGMWFVRCDVCGVERTTRDESPEELDYAQNEDDDIPMEMLTGHPSHTKEGP